MSRRGSNTSKERKVKVSSRFKGISPNSNRNTPQEGHAQLSAKQSTQMLQSQPQGKITQTTLMDQSEMSVTVDIARFMRKVCLMSNRAVNMDGDNINNKINIIAYKLVHI